MEEVHRVYAIKFRDFSKLRALEGREKERDREEEKGGVGIDNTSSSFTKVVCGAAVFERSLRKK